MDWLYRQNGIVFDTVFLLAIFAPVAILAAVVWLANLDFALVPIGMSLYAMFFALLGFVKSK